MPVALDNIAWIATKNIAFSDLTAMAALGLGQFALLIALLNFGLQHIGAAQAALIFGLFPLLTMLLSATLGREPISARLGCGVLLSITGVALSLVPKLASFGADPWWGELAVLASACVGACCSVFYCPYLRRPMTFRHAECQRVRDAGVRPFFGRAGPARALAATRSSTAAPHLGHRHLHRRVQRHWLFSVAVRAKA